MATSSRICKNIYSAFTRNKLLGAGYTNVRYITEKAKYDRVVYPPNYSPNQPSYYNTPAGLEEYFPPEPAEEMVGYTEHKCPEEWQYVDRLFPKRTVPPIPKHESYPTPSGWKPPADPRPDLPYYIRRNRMHGFSIILHCKDHNTRYFTTLKFVEGDIWALEKDLRTFLQNKTQKIVATQVNEPTRWVKFKGSFRDEIIKWCFDQGF